MTGEQPDTGPMGPEEGAHMFPERLKALREGENLDRKTLAELCGLSKTSSAGMRTASGSPPASPWWRWRTFSTCRWTICWGGKNSFLRPFNVLPSGEPEGRLYSMGVLLDKGKGERYNKGVETL